MKKLALAFIFTLALVPLSAHTATEQLQQAQMFFEKKSYKKCISLCDKVLDKDPSVADAYYWKARALEAQEKPLDAANEYKAALIARAEFPEARDGLARVTSLLSQQYASN